MRLPETLPGEEVRDFVGWAVASPSALEQDFPAAMLSQIAESESWRKEVHRPATSTHKWWAKRLGSVFRGIIGAAVSESAPEAVAAYGGEVDLNQMVILDPFAGSGTTAVEATKLGARAISLDINPVATLVQRQAVQSWDLTELENAFAAVEKSCRAEIDRLHRTESGESVLYYFWIAGAECPVCSNWTRLFSTQVFSQHAYPKREPQARAACPTCLDVVTTRYDFERATCSNGHEFSREGAVKRGKMRCPAGHVSSIIEALGDSAPRYELFAKMVLGTDGTKRYEPITEFDRELNDEAAKLLKENAAYLVHPGGALDDGENTAQATRWGFKEWRAFFNPRQLYCLGLLGAAIRDLDCRAPEREALVALFSGTLEFNNMFCSFKGEGTGAVRHMFSHHVLKPERTPLEAHPWGTPASSGSFSTLFERRLRRAHAYKTDPIDQILQNDRVERIKGASFPLERQISETWPEFDSNPASTYVAALDSSATDLPDESVDLVVTDPPYMDNVHYSELADFFHAWLRELRPFDSYPISSPSTRDSREVQSASPADFESAIAGVWKDCSRVLRAEGLLAFTFHQARITGWVALVAALAEADFVITAVQPIKGEMSTSSTKYGREPSNLDAIVVCRKRASASWNFSQLPSAAVATAETRLERLTKAGIKVGAGDIRSVVRGQVLALYTVDPEGTDLARLSAEADVLAEEAVAKNAVIARAPSV